MKTGACEKKLGCCCTLNCGAGNAAWPCVPLRSRGGRGANVGMGAAMPLGAVMLVRADCTGLGECASMIQPAMKLNTLVTAIQIRIPTCMSLMSHLPITD